MWASIRKAVLTHKLNEIKGELQRAGESVQALLMEPDILKRLDSDTAWRLIHGLEASFRIVEDTVRGILGAGTAPDAGVARALRDVQAAAATLRETLDGLMPYVEGLYGPPRSETRWQVIPPEAK